MDVHVSFNDCFSPLCTRPIGCRGEIMKQLVKVDDLFCDMLNDSIIVEVIGTDTTKDSISLEKGKALNSKTMLLMSDYFFGSYSTRQLESRSPVAYVPNNMTSRRCSCCD